MNAAHLMMPGGAIELVDTLGALAGGRYMLLAHGAGVRDTQQLRFGGMRLPESCLDGAGSDSALNYHALGLHLRADATVHQQAGVRGTQVLTLALAGAGEAMLDALTPLLRGVSSAVPTALALGQGQGQSMAQLLAVLEATHDDPAVLQAIYPAAAGKLARADDAWPYAWRAALARCWRHCLPGANAAGAGRKIAVLATRIGYWGLAKEIYRQLLGWEQGGATERYQLACCEAETGNLDAAIEQMAQLRQRPGASATHQLYHDNLLRRREERRARRGACLDGIGDGELTLETLGGEHAASLHYQFRDPQISTMTGLPPLESPGDAVRWIQTHIGEDSRTSYAVMHQELGFIGVVSLQRADGCGYFFFWMGTDFQGGGYGTRAGRLLCEHHAALGIEHIFTSAYADNVRSRAALGKIGFVEIGIRAKAPFDGMRFFFRGPPGETEHTLRRKLVAFCAQSHSSFDFGSDEAAPSPGAEQA